MNSTFQRFAQHSCLLAACGAWQLAAGQTPDAWDGWELVVSPYTYHFHPSDEHKPVFAVTLYKGLEGYWMAGGSAFSNSFGQPSAYAFVGQRYISPFGWDRWYLQWTAGVLYGYVGQFKDKVPFNYKGFSPGFVPSVGYQFSENVYGELDLLGNSALMFSLVFPLSNNLKSWF